MSRTSLHKSTAYSVRSSSGPVAEPVTAPLLAEATGIDLNNSRPERLKDIKTFFFNPAPAGGVFEAV